jgi:hypothetical protein
MNNQLMRDIPPGAVRVAHPSGWVQAHISSQWFMHFLEKSKPSENSPALLILDGHYSHTRNVEVIEMARANHVTIVSLPPHSTHKLEPLDKTFMGPLQISLQQKLKQWRQTTSQLPEDLKDHHLLQLYAY